jgi:chromosome segregation protein
MASERIDGIQVSIEELGKRREHLEAEARALGESLAELESGIEERNQSLVDREQELKKRMGELEAEHARIERTQIELSSLRTDIRNVYENFADRYSRDLRDYQDRMLEIREPMGVFRERLSSLKGRLQDLGQVNLMAPEEFEEVKERYEFLSGQMEDLAKAGRDLEQVTKTIREESTQLFSATYEQIKRSFHAMFRRLFGGGRAELALTDPHDVLSSGIEIMAQPPGKRLESIHLLSGGERSLTAVALLFATYMVKPSPFCILDEIDAALDEENVGRFVSLLREFSRTSQFVVITHNKRTVVNADSLLGITMEESGISKVISVRLGAKEEVPA